MKRNCIALIAATGGLVAANAPRELAFKDTTIPLPALELSRAAATVPKTHSPRGTVAPSSAPMYFPTEPTDLIAPTPTRQMLIESFQTSQRSKADRIGAEKIRKPTIYYPISAPDLIGRESDREKLIEDFKSRNRSER